jgi:hypothetical protein
MGKQEGLEKSREGLEKSKEGHEDYAIILANRMSSLHGAATVHQQ